MDAYLFCYRSTPPFFEQRVVYRTERIGILARLHSLSAISERHLRGQLMPTELGVRDNRFVTVRSRRSGYAGDDAV
jgi:hypothetical protein